jgi:hypothetical protein
MGRNTHGIVGGAEDGNAQEGDATAEV